jgi:hypothetical protein
LNRNIRWSSRPGAGRRTAATTLARRAGALALALLLSAAATKPLGAQEGAGRIVGRVVDAETGRGLAGAQVVVQGTSTGTLAGLDGRYVLARVPVGSHAVRVTYLGYAEKVVTGVEVAAGGAVHLDIALEGAAIAVEGITVSATRDRGTVSRALDEQRTAVAVVNSISAEQIARSPDSDAAAAIQRVSGVTVQEGRFVFVRGLGERYTTTSLNGARVPSAEPERKMVPLDLFPAGLLETITTSKTFTPNLPGDFSGALVDIRTREYPTQRQLTLSASLGYQADVTGRILPMAPTSGGERFASATAPRRLPGEVGSLSGSTRPGPETNRVVNSFRNAWSAEQAALAPNQSFGVSLGGNDELAGRRLGYLLSGTYANGQEASLDQRRAKAGAAGSEYDRFDGQTGRNSVLLGGLLNLSTMFGTHSRVFLNNTYNRSADNEARVERGFYENHATNVQIERLRYVERSVQSSQLVGEHQLTPRNRLDWSLTRSGVSRSEPDRSEYVTWLDPAVPVWYNEEGANRNFADLSERNLEGAVNYRLDFGSASRQHALRFGAMARNTVRDATSVGYAIKSPVWTPTDPRWQLAPEQFFDGRFSRNGEQNFQIAPMTAGGSYEADDRLLAGYAMLEYAVLPRLQLVGGLRVEQSDLDLRYENQLGDPGRAEPSYTDLLPAATLNLDLTGTQKLRLSASQTLARPEYREIAPVTYREVLGGEQVVGNPSLRRTLIRNYDVRWEWYPAPAEALSFGLFAKRFLDPIEQRYLARSGTDSRTFENALGATNFGVEVEVVRNLGALAEPLEALAVFANATLMRSVVDTGVAGDLDRPMVGQAPYVVNAGFTYAPLAGGLSATLLYNVVGERIINARPSGSQVDDVIEAPRQVLDLGLRFPLWQSMSGKVDLKNLLDAPYRVTQGEVVREYHRSGRAATIGVSWRP